MNDDKKLSNDSCPKCGSTRFRMEFKDGKWTSKSIELWACGMNCREDHCPEGEHFHLECRGCGRWSWERPLDFVPGSEPEPRVETPKKWWQFWK